MSSTFVTGIPGGCVVRNTFLEWGDREAGDTSSLSVVLVRDRSLKHLGHGHGAMREICVNCSRVTWDAPC